jgi:hypothetical protein
MAMQKLLKRLIAALALAFIGGLVLGVLVFAFMEWAASGFAI